MNRELKVDEVRGFLAAANRKFEQGNIFLHSVRFKRDETTGEVVDIILSYGQRENKPENENSHEQRDRI